MSKLIVDTKQLRSDAKNKFEVWGDDLTSMWNQMAEELATHTDKSYFGDAVDGIARFHEYYTTALETLHQYLVGTTGSATAAFSVFSYKLTAKAADVYDQAVDPDIHDQLQGLPQA